MKKNRSCPKCNSRDILTNANYKRLGHRAYLNPTIWFRLRVETYLCMGCGFVEEYLEEGGFNNQNRLDKLRQSWNPPK